ncbi:hypothetical protein [Oleispirillum naphthae]|uniref:hypothetical protein n=1 Tax=Oleispirillum naphthae TaxID=2838853 RepID=UPI00308256E4
MAGKDIHALIRLKKWMVDEERRILGQMLAQEAVVARRRAALEDEVRREQTVAAADPAGLAGRAYGDFAAAAVARRTRLDQERILLEAAISGQRDKVAEVYRDFKTLEQIQKNRDLRAAAERARKEQAALDEIAAINHRRRNAG